MYSDELSDLLRMSLQPLAIFRQLCDAQDATEKGLHRGDTYRWNTFSDVGTQGRRLAENQPLPETNFTVNQTEMEVFEMGNSVPYTGKLEALAKQDVVAVVTKTLRNDARKAFDIEAFLAFDECLLRVAPAGGTSTDSLTLTENGSTATTNDVEFGADHAKAVVDLMVERNIPPFAGDDYIAVSHPTTFRPMKNDLESLHQYTGEGLSMILNGEMGRYEGMRYLKQNQIPKGGAINSATFDPYSNTADPWTSGKSSWIYFAGEDTVGEAIVVPEEIRAKLPTDYGRAKGIAWYALVGYGLIHQVASQSRVIKWDSAA